MGFRQITDLILFVNLELGYLVLPYYVNVV